ncbi:MAG: VanZ family protein [Anaerobutyricum soehngenii]
MLAINYSTENVWNNVILDFRQPISYLLPAIIITMAGVLIYKIYKKEKARIHLSCVLLIIYVEILMQTAFFSRESGSRRQIDLDLFETWGYTAITHAYFIENIIMFIPFGILAPIVFKQMRKVGICGLTGFMFSCGIEISQLITQRGYCQLDDVVTNTVGMLAGWVTWRVLDRVINKKNEESI